MRSTRRVFRAVCLQGFAYFCLGFPPAHAAQHHTAQLNATDSSTQMLVVTTPDWNSMQGTLQRYERRALHGKWKQIGPQLKVVVGRNGLGWDAGMLAGDSSLHFVDDPVKREGDGKAPAGIFRLGTAFGYASQEQAGWKMPYLGITDATQCVDDISSRFYNRVLDRQSISAPDWNSNEEMHRKDNLYQWGLIVEYNSDPPVPGRGSCIFMHIWKGPAVGTSGCTAMEQPNLESLLQWLDAEKHPVLVQLPVSRYKKLRKHWRLPRL